MAVPGIDKFDFCLFVCLLCSTMFPFCFWRILFFFSFLEEIDPWAWETFDSSIFFTILRKMFLSNLLSLLKFVGSVK